MPTLQKQKRAAQKRYGLFKAHFRDGIYYAELARRKGITPERVRDQVVQFVDDMSTPGRKHIYRGFRL